MKETTTQAGSTAILVLGMHRSGTSATTRVINLLGAELGSELLQPQPDNLKGFWEHQDAVRINERVLSAFGLDWHDLRELPHDWLEHPASLKAVEEIVELIRRDFSGARLWAVKDPRMCRLAPLWIRALNQLGVRATAVIVVRDPREVAASLKVRDGWSCAHSWLMWTQHMLEAIDATEDLPRVMLPYDDLIKDWAGGIARIGRELGISWPRDPDSVSPEIGAFISPADRHHQASNLAAAVHQDDRPPHWLMQLMDRCLLVSEGQHEWSSLAALHGEYALNAELFLGPIAELTCKWKACERVAMQRLEIIGQVQREIAAHSEALKGAAFALSAKSIDHDAWLQKYETLLQKYEALLQEHEALQHAFDRHVAAHAELQALHTDLSVKYGLLEEALDAQRIEQARVEAVAAELLQAKAQLQQQLERTRFLTRSRRWLLRRVAQVTFGKSTLSNVDFD